MVSSAPQGQTQFIADPYTPSVNGLATAGLLTNNPNSANAFRLDRSEAIIYYMNHEYTAEQQAYNAHIILTKIN